MNDVLEPNGYKNNPDIDSEALARINSNQRLRGIELERKIVGRLQGLVDGFDGHKLWWGNKDTDNPNIGYFSNVGKGLPPETLSELLIGGIFPDIDILIANQTNEVVCVISSKGSLCDSNAYASALHAQNLNCPFYVVTKDEPGVYKSGKSKYITLYRNLGLKVFISNHDDYTNDKGLTESGKWEGYHWNDVVQPEHRLHDEIFNEIQKKNSEHRFFDFEKI